MSQEDAAFWEPRPEHLVGAGWTRTIRWMADMRAREPVALRAGVYNVFRASDVRRVLSDTDIFSSDRTDFMPSTAQLGRGNLTMMDPPDHTRVRRIINQAFTARSIAGLEPSVEELARALVDRLEPDGFEVVGRVAYPMPVLVITELLGLPRSDIPLFRNWSVGFSRGLSSAMESMHGYLLEQASRRRREPSDDLISRMAHAELDGVAPTDDEVATLAGLVLLAGHVTTTSLIAACLLHLTEYAEVDARVRRTPDLVPDLVEETLRTRPSFTQVTRVVRRATTVAGTRLPVGAPVSAWILSANHDPDLNADGEKFALQRTDRRHLAFGHGVHYCLGSALARMEAIAVTRSVIERFAALQRREPVSFHPHPALAVKRLHLRGELA